MDVHGVAGTLEVLASVKVLTWRFGIFSTNAAALALREKLETLLGGLNLI